MPLRRLTGGGNCSGIERSPLKSLRTNLAFIILVFPIGPRHSCENLPLWAQCTVLFREHSHSGGHIAFARLERCRSRPSLCWTELGREQCFCPSLVRIRAPHYGVLASAGSGFVANLEPAIDRFVGYSVDHLPVPCIRLAGSKQLGYPGRKKPSTLQVIQQCVGALT